MTLKIVTATPTITAGAYSAGDAVGGLLEFEGVASPYDRGAIIVAATLIDKAAQKALMRLILFDRTFTPTADNAPFDPTDADLANVLKYLTFAATDYISFNDNSMAQRLGDLGDAVLASVVLAEGGTSLFGQLVTGGTPTYASTSDLIVKLTIER